MSAGEFEGSRGIPFLQMPDGRLVVATGFEEAVDRGRVYGIANQAGDTMANGLSATTPVLTLPNPLGSGIKAKIWFLGVQFNIAFSAVAALFVAVNTDPSEAAVTGTPTTAHRNYKLGGRKPGIVPMLNATLPSAPVAIDLLGEMGTGAVSTIPGQPTHGRWYNGGLILMPGTAVSIQSESTGPTNGAFCSYIWEEEDIDS